MSPWVRFLFHESDPYRQGRPAQCDGGSHIREGGAGVAPGDDPTEVLGEARAKEREVGLAVGRDGEEVGTRGGRWRWRHQGRGQRGVVLREGCWVLRPVRALTVVIAGRMAGWCTIRPQGT
jgi:hypothetical protein